MGESLRSLRDQVVSIWNSMSLGRRTAVGGGVLLLFAALVFFVFLSAKTGFRPLYSELRPEAAGEVVAYLKDNDIPYKVGNDGASILVPEEKVHEVRLELASSELPRGGVVGMELWDRVGIGETEFDRRIKYIRALQGELTRTILSISSVANARVHIVLPERSLFSQTDRPATASVFIENKAGSTLALEQVRAIVHLMATSVEGLSPERVTVIDHRGNVLSDGLATSSESFGAAGGSQSALSRFQVERAFERELELSLQTMLERVFGYGSVVLRVNAALNLDYQEENLELHEPIVDGAGLIVSEQESSENFTGSGPQGGAAGVATNVPGYAAQDQNDSGEYRRQDATRSYVVNRRETHVLRAPGRVERLSVAVWLDGDIPQARRQAVEDMVASAVGLQPERGDAVMVDFMEFDDASMTASAAGLQQTVSETSFPSWAYGGIAGLAVLVLLGAIRMRRRPQPAPAGPTPRVDVVVGDTAEEGAELTPQERASQRTQSSIEKMAQKDPEAFVALLRAWLDEE